MYMKYCELGDSMAEWERTNPHRVNPPRRPIPEDYIWRVLDYLARALMVLEKGSKNPAVGIALIWKPILHLDIKLENSKSHEALTIWRQSKLIVGNHSIV